MLDSLPSNFSYQPSAFSHQLILLELAASSNLPAHKPMAEG